MNREEAKIILNIIEDDEAQDRYEEEIFQLIQVFLKDPVLPSLAEGRKKKIVQLSEAVHLFSFEKNLDFEFNPINLSELNNISEWKILLNEYEQNKAKIRREIARTYDAIKLCRFIDSLMANEIQYANVLNRYTTKVPLDVHSKISEAVAVPDILKECENLQTKGIINTTLQSFENINENLSIFNLSKEVNRLRKLVKNG